MCMYMFFFLCIFVCHSIPVSKYARGYDKIFRLSSVDLAIHSAKVYPVYTSKNTRVHIGVEVVSI